MEYEELRTLQKKLNNPRPFFCNIRNPQTRMKSQRKHLLFNQNTVRWANIFKLKCWCKWYNNYRYSRTRLLKTLRVTLTMHWLINFWPINEFCHSKISHCAPIVDLQIHFTVWIYYNCSQWPQRPLKFNKNRIHQLCSILTNYLHHSINRNENEYGNPILEIWLIR